MDLVQTAVIVGSSVAGYVISEVRASARTGKRMETVEEVQEKHGQRLDVHDTKFDELNTRFVPRQELEGTMDSIRESQKRTERWLERLILGRVPPISSGEEGKF
jgi:TolA-binding protein